VVQPKSIRLIGTSDIGTLYAAYELLEQLGVRWLMPGRLGEDVPQAKTVSIAEQDTVQRPGFSGRHLQAVAQPAWERRMRLSGLNAGAHGLGPKFDRETEPELFILEDGKRTHQEDVAQPEVLRRVVAYWLDQLENKPGIRYIAVGPHDGAGFGDHPWDAVDLDPFTGRNAMTDRYIKFYNMVLDEIQKKYPDVGLAFYAYTRDLTAPVREKPNPKILPVLAPINFDRFHSIKNPLSWEKQYIKQVVDGWRATGVNMMYRGYFFNLADQGLPFSMLDMIKTDFPYYHEQGMIACRVECIPMWPYHAPSLYLAAKIFWNPDLDADAVIDDWFKRYYGPAAVPMRKHFDVLEDAFVHGDYFTGNVADMPHFLNSEVRAAMRTSLEEAEKLAAGTGIYAERTKFMRLGFDYGEANLAMMAAYRRCDFVEARRLYDQIETVMVVASDSYDPPALHKSNVGYLKRFWSKSIHDGADRQTGGNEMVVQLPDELFYMQDPYNGGEKMGLWKPELGTQSWLPLKTYSTSTSNQGLRYYKGTLWYRTTAVVDAKYKGRPLKLWLAGVDDTAEAWVNGVKLTVLTKGAAPFGRPWEFDLADSVKSGEPNVIVISVADTRINELGTAGLNGPAMIWAAPK